MVHSCVAIECTNHYKAGLGISFQISSQQTKAIAKIEPGSEKKRLETKLSFICSTHFKPLCFEVRAGKIGYKLCNDAGQLIFQSFLKYYQI